MKIYNTLTRQKETFKPIHEGTVKMYVCGPTVYNYIHIGNARSIVAFDTIRRYFEYKKMQVTFVSNFTDVDDKMINEAAKEGITVPELAEKFIAAFLKDTKALNVERATVNPRATHEIPEIISFIEKLIEKGYAYEVDGDVYYRVKKFPNYGALAGKKIDELEAGASEHVDETEQNRKEDLLDFALWKAQKGDEIAWNSPWGKGRPGWHIECSVMSTKYLGDTFDIHGGGQDLEFPHHENEIAQSEAKTGQKFVNYWMHNGFVTVGDEKMSKSLNNFVTVHDMLEKVDPQVVRFFMSSVHYRRQINFSDDNLRQAETNLHYFKNTLESLHYRLKDETDQVDEDLRVALTKTETEFELAMDDDFNVQNALTSIHQFLTLLNQKLNETAIDHEALLDSEKHIAAWLKVFGIDVNEWTEAQDGDAEIDALVKKRDEARKAKDWATSDQIRDQLKDMGITLLDTPNGTRWSRD
ncbi:MAG: cysteine--tRNA ligase [Lactobacillus sp.]|nr:cysteine--tRNA ligase [Lactobacillus sp.]